MKLTQTLTILMFFCIITVSVFAQNFTIDNSMKNVIAKYENTELTKENFKSAIKEMNIKYYDNVYIQGILESGHFKSKLASNGNNLFGMRKPGSRNTFAEEKKIYGYAKFKSWIYSVADYKLWQDNKPPKLNESYIQYLKRRNYNIYWKTR
jgi:uncharacterized FlgJ-related protein